MTFFLLFEGISRLGKRKKRSITDFYVHRPGHVTAEVGHGHRAHLQPKESKFRLGGRGRVAHKDTSHMIV